MKKIIKINCYPLDYNTFVPRCLANGVGIILNTISGYELQRTIDPEFRHIRHDPAYKILFNGEIYTLLYMTDWHNERKFYILEFPPLTDENVKYVQNPYFIHPEDIEII